MEVNRYYPRQRHSSVYDADEIVFDYETSPAYEDRNRQFSIPTPSSPMAGPPQYPPPAPPAAHGYQQTPQQQSPYPYAQPQHYQHQHGGAATLPGPEGYTARGGYSGPQQQPPHGFPGQPQHQASNAQYDPRNPAPYIGPQPPHAGQNAQVQQPPHWQQQHQQYQQRQHYQQHQQPGYSFPNGQPLHQAPPPRPLFPQDYHPNYAPQTPHAFRPPQQSPQQSPHFQPPASYGHSVPPSPQTPQQWNTTPLYNQPQFAPRGRGRGGFTGRGGHEAPLAGPPIWLGFGSEKHRANSLPQASSGLTPQFAQPSPTIQSTPYQGSRPSFDSPVQSGYHRGRGNNMNSRGRGRGDSQSQRGNHSRFSSQQPSDVQSKPVKHKNKKKRQTNTLGLTPNGVEHEESEDEVDDVDEEARLVTLLGPDTPQLPTDLAAWLAERKALFPTKARREAAAEAQRKQREELQKIKKEQEVKIKKEPETDLEKHQRKAEKLRLELEKAERKIQDTLAGSKRKREDGDEGDNASDSTSSSEPEAMPSRLGGPMRVPPPPKAQLQRHCKYFSTGGTCGKKGKCRFVHDQEVRNQALRDKEANGGKMTLAQRLILNDTAKDDLTILKSIKYLKEKGKMPEQAASAEDEEGQNGMDNPYGDELQYGEV